MRCGRARPPDRPSRASGRSRRRRDAPALAARPRRRGRPSACGARSPSTPSATSATALPTTSAPYPVVNRSAGRHADQRVHDPGESERRPSTPTPCGRSEARPSRAQLPDRVRARPQCASTATSPPTQRQAASTCSTRLSLATSCAPPVAEWPVRATGSGPSSAEAEGDHRPPPPEHGPAGGEHQQGDEGRRQPRRRACSAGERSGRAARRRVPRRAACRACRPRSTAPSAPRPAPRRARRPRRHARRGSRRRPGSPERCGGTRNAASSSAPTATAIAISASARTAGSPIVVSRSGFDNPGTASTGPLTTRSAPAATSGGQHGPRAHEPEDTGRTAPGPGCRVGPSSAPWVQVRPGARQEPRSAAGSGRVRRLGRGAEEESARVRRDVPSTRSATTHVMLSGPPPSFASAMRRSTASAGSATSARTSWISSSSSTAVTPSEQTRNRSPTRPSIGEQVGLGRAALLQGADEDRAARMVRRPRPR